MTLHINDAAIGVGEQRAAATHETWDTMESVLTEVTREGFHLMDQPQFAPPEVNPNTLTHTTPEEYALKFAQAEHWQSYDATVLAWIDGMLLQCVNEMDIIEVDTRQDVRKTYKEAQEKMPSLKVIDDMVKSNGRWRELLLYTQQLTQKRKMVEAHYKRMSRTLSILSRYVEFRKNEVGGPSAGRRGPF